MYTIRRFHPDDIFSIAKLASETLSEQYSPNLFSFCYEVFPEGFLVVEHQKKIIGFIIGVQATSTSGRILMMSIDESYRRKGVGSALLIQLMHELNDKKITQIELEVKTSNTPAISFYMKHGFIITKKMKRFYQDGGNAFVMGWHYSR